MENDSNQISLILINQNLTQSECEQLRQNWLKSHLFTNECEPTWDDFICWKNSSPGVMLKISCHDVLTALQLSPPNDSLINETFAFRICKNSGEWLWKNYTDYTNCLAFLPTTLNNHGIRQFIGYIVFLGSLISLILLLISFFIFYYFTSLKCARFKVHRNLIISLTLHYTLNIIITIPLVTGSGSYRDFEVFCKTLICFKLYALMSSINWMFVEGLFLQSRLSMSFQTSVPFKLYYAIGWGIPTLIIITWAILMEKSNTNQCWSGYGKLNYIWIITVPMFIALIMNFFFLINVLRVLIQKMNDPITAEAKQTRKAIKATFFLFPLLGLSNLIFCINPQDEDQLEEAYMIINSIFQSSQGIFVSILYCLNNYEVKRAIRSKFQAWSQNHEIH